MFEFITVRELYEMFLSNQMMDLEGYEYVELEGWVRTNRNNIQKQKFLTMKKSINYLLVVQFE